MKRRVIQAIRECQLLHVQDGKRRRLTVAPLVLGYTLAGYTARLYYQAGWSGEDETHWRLLVLDRITEMKMLDIPFGPRSQGRLPSGGSQAIEVVIQPSGVQRRRTESVQQLYNVDLISWIFGPTS